MTVALANLAICASVGGVLAATGGSADSTTDSTTTTQPTIIETTWPYPTTDPTSSEPWSTTSDTSSSPVGSEIPDGFERVDGPNGMSTVIPMGWPTGPSTGTGNFEAVDPTDSTRVLKYGGATAPAPDIYSSHVDYAADVAKRPGYRQIRLDSTTFRDTDAIDWEFEIDSASGTRHVRSLYWRVDGIEYFVYAASLESRWAQTLPLFEAMITYATP